MKTDLLVVGAGAGGLSSAYAAVENGVKSVFILEKTGSFGGVLRQCIHSGFGSVFFNEEMTGPEYASKLFNMLNFSYVKFFFSTTVLNISFTNRTVYAISPKFGLLEINFKAIVIATGCYEAPIGRFNVPGTRPAGIISAGVAQKFINVLGYLPGERIVMYGSNIVGLTVARRLMVEGAKVQCILEPLPFCRAPLRDEYLCQIDYNIHIFYSKSISRLFGKKRIEGIEIRGTAERSSKCVYTELDTLVFALDMIPETSLFFRKNFLVLDSLTNGPVVDQFMQTTIPGVYACGNNVYIHNAVDFVTKDALKLGCNAAMFVKRFPNYSSKPSRVLNLNPDGNIEFVVPQRLILNKNTGGTVDIFFKVKKVLKNVSIICEILGIEIFSQGKPYLIPSRIEKFTLNLKKLAPYNGNDISVSLVNRD